MLHAGWPNGDISGVENDTIFARHTSSDSSLWIYNTTTDSNGAVSRSHVVADLGSFTATSRPWYTAGKACGRYNNSRWGYTCITERYQDSNGVYIVSIVQPFFAPNYEFVGVCRRLMSVPTI